MRKIYSILVLFIIHLFIGCSSESNDLIDDTDIVMNFEIPNNFNYEGVPLTDKYINNDGSIDYSISGLVQRVGSNPLFQQDSYVELSMGFTLDSEIQVNQIIQIQNFNSIGGRFPYNDNNFSGIDFCALELEKQQSSTGFLKITEITEDYIRGEFQFNNLNNTGGVNPLTSQPCPNYPSQQNYNIINGSFTAFNPF
ncbi:hypothetical protein [uncultured Flavobacterium sp.]|uniref:hypothetical protein n=1 Tax=uncultured Flavobacterium sp. TaxID=165435 RepID=UPI00261A1C7E|nr:hypothetical protein [uncultured Flavobacterium sp.]